MFKSHIITSLTDPITVAANNPSRLLVSYNWGQGIRGLSHALPHPLPLSPPAPCTGHQVPIDPTSRMCYPSPLSPAPHHCSGIHCTGSLSRHSRFCRLLPLPSSFTTLASKHQ